VPLAPEHVTAIARRLAAHAGLELPAWVVEARAQSRMFALGIAAPDYVALIDSGRGEAELEELIEAVRVGESRLFRHRQQIAALVDVVAPALRARGKRAIKVWSAGCAAGEEPYTLAAVLSAALPSVQLSIIATDVSADALELGRRATYPTSAWNEIPEPYRDAFVNDGTCVRPTPATATLVRFERANLAAQLDASPIRGCDLVWCRNVLIYFTPAARKLALERLVGALGPGGFLFVGYSESLRDVSGLVGQRAGDATYYIKGDGAPMATWRTPPAGIPRLPTPQQIERLDIAIPRTQTPGVLVVHGVTRTPSTGMPALPRPPSEVTIALTGEPSARDVTHQLTRSMANAGLETLIVDLDGAQILPDDLAPVLRRARAAARAAQVDLQLRATRTGSRRWLARHDLDDDGGGR
jgi:chemotaxis protein methyltransferase CheR